VPYYLCGSGSRSSDNKMLGVDALSTLVAWIFRAGRPDNPLPTTLSQRCYGKVRLAFSVSSALCRAYSTIFQNESLRIT
jgi:hypothetical protein